MDNREIDRKSFSKSFDQENYRIRKLSRVFVIVFVKDVFPVVKFCVGRIEDGRIQMVALIMHCI